MALKNVMNKQKIVSIPKTKGMPNIAEPALGRPATSEPSPVKPVQPALRATIIAAILRGIEIPVSIAISSSIAFLALEIFSFTALIFLLKKPIIPDDFCLTPQCGQISAAVLIAVPQDSQNFSSGSFVLCSSTFSDTFYSLSLQGSKQSSAFPVTFSLAVLREMGFS